MQSEKAFTSYRFCEGRTGIGQAVRFTCRPDEAEQVGAFLRDKIRTIDRPMTGRTRNIAHGTYGRYTRYNIKQHDYAGGGSGYIEVLEIQDPPEERHGIVIFNYDFQRGASFSEWETLGQARKAWDHFLRGSNPNKEFPKLPGFKRLVLCGALTPWFYAFGEEHLIGDYAFPDGLQDDAVYRFGRQFVLTDRENNPTVKTCMGTRLITRKSERHPYKEEMFRVVYWDDGSYWDEHASWDTLGHPRPLEAGELWITEAIDKFRALLAGKSTAFSIDFSDGSKFSGKLVQKRPRVPCAEGEYFATVHVKGEKKPRTGVVGDFIPTPETPDIVSYITKRFTDKGNEVERIKVKANKTKKNGKKWAGVFFRPPQ